NHRSGREQCPHRKPASCRSENNESRAHTRAKCGETRKGRLGGVRQSGCHDETKPGKTQKRASSYARAEKDQGAKKQFPHTGWHEIKGGRWVSTRYNFADHERS